MGRKELLLALALLFLLGVGATAARLLEARRTGLSLRLQVFIPLAATTLLLSAMFAGIVDRKSTRLNSSHSQISYAVFCLKKKKTKTLPALHEICSAGNSS